MDTYIFVIIRCSTRGAIFQTFLFVILFGIGAYHLVALAERSSNLQSDSKKLIVVARDSSFRVDVRNAATRDSVRDPPCGGLQPKTQLECNIRRGRGAFCPIFIHLLGLRTPI